MVFALPLPNSGAPPASWAGRRSTGGGARGNPPEAGRRARSRFRYASQEDLFADEHMAVAECRVHWTGYYVVL